MVMIDKSTPFAKSFLREYFRYKFKNNLKKKRSQPVAHNSLFFSLTQQETPKEGILRVPGDQTGGQKGGFCVRRPKRRTPRRRFLC